jgi:CheY-like chemotaxis protein
MDDDDAVCNVTANLLSSAGYRIIEANSAEEAMRVTVGSGPRIDLPLTDLIMSGQRGFEKLRTSESTSP